MSLHFQSQNDFAMVFDLFVSGTFQHRLFMNMGHMHYLEEKVTGQLVFCNNFTLGETVFCKSCCSPLAMSSDTFCTVPNEACN